MNESQNHKPIFPFIFLVFFICIFFIVVLKYNKNSQTIDIFKSTQTTSESESGEVHTGSAIEDKYIQKILSQNQGGSLNSSDRQNIEKNISDEIENATYIPDFKSTLASVGIYDQKFYTKEFNKIFANFVKQGMTIENDIFTDQVKATEKLLSLSEYDKETILNSAKQYGEFAKAIQILKTPIIFKLKSEETVKTSLELSYLLKKIVEEKDERIYTIWLNKYIERIFVIITAVYVE